MTMRLIVEKALMRNIGEPYQSYMKRTKRLIPFLIRRGLGL